MNESLTKIAVIVGVSAFLGIFAWGVIYQILLRTGVIRNPAKLEPYIKLGVFTLFFIFALCCMPLLIRLFLAGQGSVGNEDVGMVRFLGDHFVGVTFGLWAFLLLGMLIALPVMWTDFFGFPARKQNVDVTDKTPPE